MMVKTRAPLSYLAAMLLLGSGALTAQVAKQGNDVLSSLQTRSEKLSPSQPLELLDDVRSLVATPTQNGWAAFRLGTPVDWRASIDKRTGMVGFAEGGGIGWIPGRGNSLAQGDVAKYLHNNKIDMVSMEKMARDYLPRVASLLGVDAASLVLNQARSGQPASHVWFVDFDVYSGGLPIENARVVFRVNSGNLIQFGTENLPHPGAVAPAATLTSAQALAAVAKYVGGFNSLDSFRDSGSLHQIVVNVDNSKFNDGFEFGKGRGLAKVWQFVFHRDGVMGTWQARVDAATGEILQFADINDYAAATGGVYQNSPATGSEIVRPMPYADVSTSLFTNSGGIFTGTATASTLKGTYVKITDSCGAISQAPDGSGNIVFGTSTGTDCTTPGHGGAGNTHSSRQQFYQVNRIKEVVRGWLPTNTWINQALTVNVNLNQTCNAYWNGSTLNFFKSGGGCANTGEIAAVSLHEFGHGIDQNDGTGTAPEGGTGEAYGDVTSVIATHNSCIGPGFLTSNCAGYGNACTSCTGVRDIDFAKHSSGAAATVANFTQVRCSAGSGPCGKEVHCESYVPSEAIWDFANRDLPNPGTGEAWTTLDRLWYLSRNTATSSFTCTTGGTFTSNGCGTGSWWKTMRAVDDDDGNLSNGTPHSAALFAAFNRHGIACTTDAGASTSFRGCTQPTTPTLSVTAGNNSASLSWTSSGSAVYDVFRNETGCNAGFTKIASGTSATSLADSVVANGLTYFYQVTAFPSGNEACASAPSSCIAVTPTTTTCTPPAAPAGLTTSVSGSTVNLSWGAVSGATYHILRSTTSGGPYTQVGTSSTTSFADSGLANGTYFYVVRAFTTCESANSNQASATVSVSCTPPAAPTISGSVSGSTVNLSWGAVTGATAYHVLRSTTSGGPYTQIASVTTTSYADGGLANGTYFYVVRSFSTCESANSNQLTEVVSVTGCTNTTLYSNTFESGSGLSDWTVGTFNGGTATPWRGIQVCSPASSGTHIFRYGGTSCTTAYTSNNFNFAQPKGATGIAFGATASTSRLTFKHRYNFESGFDGGTLTVSVDGGVNYFYVPSSAVLSGGYNGTVSAACPPTGAAGASIWTGSHNTSLTSTTVDLDAACNAATGLTTGCAGQTVFIGFTSITDCSTTAAGWFLDDVTVTACQ
jgi:fibronectin type 3 domain-containing protein